MCYKAFLLRFISVMYFACVHNKVTTLVYRRRLDTIFPEQLIYNCSIIPCMSKSPDLTPDDFFLWGSFTHEMYDHVYERN